VSDGIRIQPPELSHHEVLNPASIDRWGPRVDEVLSQEPAPPMNRPRLFSAGLCTIVALGLGAAAMALPGCEPPSEGRPAGSIEVKNARSSAADIDAAKAKAKTSPRRR
jgi:hypothetical protein